MNVTANAASFFQTTDFLNKAALIEEKKKNKAGNPQVLPQPSKILAVAKDPRSNSIFVAESSATLRKVQIRDDGGSPVPAKVLKTYRGPKAPLTSLAVTSKYICAGCWDKNVWVWDLESGSSRTLEGGHTDFVKSLLYIPANLPLADGSRASNKELLLSGGADAAITIWDLESGSVITTLKGNQTRGILDLAAYPFSATTQGLPIYVATSIKVVQAYNLVFDPPSLQFVEEKGNLDHHSSSVFALHVTGEGDLWSASADNTAQRCSAEQGFKADTVLEHTDYVSAVITYRNTVVTGSRDGDVKVWDSSTDKLIHSYVGHWDEVTGLILLGEADLVSVSLDGTIRSWGLSPKDLEKAKEEAFKKPEPKTEKKESLLTAEEEAELAELMDDDD